MTAEWLSGFIAQQYAQKRIERTGSTCDATTVAIASLNIAQYTSARAAMSATAKGVHSKFL